MCFRFRIFLFGVLCAVLFYPVANAYSETLEQAVTRALSGSPELNAGHLAVLETEEEKFRARSAWRPDVSLKIKGGRKQSTTETSTVPSDTTSFSPVSATLSISQHVFDFGETSATIKKSNILNFISVEQLRKARQDVIVGAVSAYIAVWRDLSLFEVAASNEKILGEQFLATEKRFSMREVTRTDVSQARARLQDAISGRIAADLSLQESLAVYEETIGSVTRLDLIEWSVDMLAAYQLPETIEAAKELAYVKNSEMRQLRLQQQLAKMSVRENKSALLPTVSIEASLSNARNSSATLKKSTDVTVEGVLTVPLYDSGKSWSKLSSAKIQVRILLENEKAKKLTLERKILSLWNTLQRTDGQISSIKSSVAANEVALQGVRREVEVGTRTTLHLLDAEKEYVQALASLVLAAHDKTRSHFLLMLECGILSDAFRN
tara:strand:- start:115 stop:1422 length:1308 start_codon:yes stop_codon:yes gene_type:complete